MAVTLPDLETDDEYQLVFVTSGSISALDDDIATYNTFVNAQAANSSSDVVTGAEWTAIISTRPNSGERAVDNAVVTVPVYNTQGEKVADDASELYGDGVQNAIKYDEDGEEKVTRVWTGSNRHGTPSGFWVGHPERRATFGKSGETNMSWMEHGDWVAAIQMPVYALSEVLTYS